MYNLDDLYLEKNNYNFKGGHIFQGTFKLTPLKFIWAIVIIIVILIIILLVGGLFLFGIKFLKLPNIITSFITVVISILTMYVSYDYIYTMGYNDCKS
jgi:hypothetical protein